MNFKEVPKKYRPIPFWSWNEKLDTEETVRQVKMMDEVGIGGFFMHARGGLQTEYMGDEWFDNISAATDEAKKRGMRPWAYDENGWPSGFGNGMVNGLGVRYQQKYLRMEDTPEHTETQIGKCGDHWFYYDINPFYVDTLDREVVKKFIDCTYEPYYKKYGTEIEGFFTDEPQVSRNGIPWSFVMEDEFRARYGEELLPCLEALFLEKGDFKNIRVKFWKMVTDLFSNSFFKQIYDWCSARGLKLTGHDVAEDPLRAQIVTNGACMPHYEYYHIPGMDWLGRNIKKGITPIQVSSVAEQLGKEAVLSETFALCGHNVSFAELKGIFEWQAVHGITLLCQHLEGYSLRGIRKRDYPPAMYYQQPWWSEYEAFNTAMSRVGMIMSQGKPHVSVLLLHPQTSAWSKFDCGENKGVEEVHNKFVDAILELERKHVLFHLGDETILERHGKVENGKLIVENCTYDIVIDECCEILLDSTNKLLDEYKSTGGKICTVAEMTENRVTDCGKLSYNRRDFDGFTAHYFVNTSPERFDAEIFVEGRALDLYTGELEEFCGKHSFEPWGSLMIVEDGTKNVPCECENNDIYLPDTEFKVVGAVENVLTLDKCDYYFDGKLEERDGYVLNICERANRLGRPVKIRMEYHLTAKYVPEKLCLVCETPEIFKISVNGRAVAEKAEGYFRDKSFEKIDIAKYLEIGENTIALECDFAQSERFYADLEKSYVFESEKNKLVYDTEIECIYLVGDFAVSTDGEWTEIERDAVRYDGTFAIDEPKRAIKLGDIQKQGFPFFSGELTVEGEIEIEKDNPRLNFAPKGVNALRIEADGFKTVVLSDDRVKLELEKGKHKIRLTLINNLRNMLGPHHLEEGESYGVGPIAFYKEPCVWNPNGNDTWREDYCFVKFGI